jgi:tetratricopeptide (TPR) repeat protein
VREQGRLVLVLGIALASSPVLAHPGPSEQLHALDERITAAPHDAGLRLRRAELRRRMGHPRDALADLKLAAALAPDDRAVLLQRALVHVAMGRPRAAERDLDRFLAVGPAHAEALAERARLRQADGRLEDARADLDAALALAADLELYRLRGRIDERLGRLDDAAAGYREGLAALGPAVVLRLALVDVERRRGAHEPALVLVDALLREAPGRADWLLLRAEILEDAGMLASATADRLQALEVARAAAERRPTPLHRLSVAHAHLALGQHGLARDALALVLRDAPRLPAALALRERLDALPEDP